MLRIKIKKALAIAGAFCYHVIVGRDKEKINTPPHPIAGDRSLSLISVTKIKKVTSKICLTLSLLDGKIHVSDEGGIKMNDQPMFHEIHTEIKGIWVWDFEKPSLIDRIKRMIGVNNA